MATYGIKSKYLDIEAYVYTSFYTNNYRLAVILVDVETGEQEHISVNLRDYPMEQPDCFYIKNGAEMTGMVEALETAGVAEKVGEAIRYGEFDSRAVLMRLLPDVAVGHI